MSQICPFHLLNKKVNCTVQLEWWRTDNAIYLATLDLRAMLTTCSKRSASQGTLSTPCWPYPNCSSAISSNAAMHGSLRSLTRTSTLVSAPPSSSRTSTMGRYMFTVKIGTNRSDRAVWPVEALWHVQQGPTGPGRVRVQLKLFYRFRSVNRISCGVSLLNPINIKGHGRLKRQPNRTNQIHLSFIVFTFPLYPTFPTSTWCSSLVSMAFEDTLAGLPSLGQPYARLPRRGPSRASVRRIAAILHGDRSDRSP